MTDTRVALGSDRLPWLQDVPERSRALPARQLLAWGTGTVLLVAGAFSWLGQLSRFGEPQPPAPVSRQRTVTTPLPEPQVLPPAQQIEIAPVPQVEPTTAPEVRPAPAPAMRPAPQKREAAPKAEEVAKKTVAAQGKAESSTPKADEPATTDKTPAAKPAAPPTLAPASSLRLWPSRVTEGAQGRVVQIGAFGSPRQAKLGWKYMARAYPGVKRLPAVVVETNNSKGRMFYRFQIGTTSQAHSEVLCQRMQKIRFSCAVMGLPLKPKGVER
jgi:hypothetical protein